jgi:hypothetical protein
MEEALGGELIVFYHIIAVLRSDPSRQFTCADRCGPVIGF